MKAFVCGKCEYVSLKKKAPEKCPVCLAEGSFRKQEDAVNKPREVDNMSELEEMHVPQLKINKNCGYFEDCRNVYVKIGEVAHPMTSEHWISIIDFYLNNSYASRIQLTAEETYPAVCIHLNAEKGKVSVVEHCNLHGMWISEIDL